MSLLAAAVPEGVFHKDTRFLSDLRVLVDGQWPLLLSSTVEDNNALLTADLTNPDLFADGDSIFRATRSRWSARSSSGRARAMSGSAFAVSAPGRKSSSSCSTSRRTSRIFSSFAAIRRKRRGKTEARVDESGVDLLVPRPRRHHSPHHHPVRSRAGDDRRRQRSLPRRTWSPRAQLHLLDGRV